MARIGSNRSYGIVLFFLRASPQQEHVDVTPIFIGLVSIVRGGAVMAFKFLLCHFVIICVSGTRLTNGLRQLQPNQLSSNLTH
jgi:hypothetical protein